MTNSLQATIDKAKVLVEALPYIKEFFGKTVVIKYGGSAMADDTVKQTVMQDIALMKFVGIRPVVVHGGGPEINQMLTRLGVTPQFSGGLRVTDAATMEVAEMVLAGKVGKDIAAQLGAQGIRAAGVSGRDGRMLTAVKKTDGDIDLGFVGQIEEVDTTLITALMDSDFVPVISSVASSAAGASFNINADYAALAIAKALRAEKLVFMTDVPGILSDVSNRESLLSSASAAELETLLREGSITSGMIPKTQCAIDATKAGVRNVHILDGGVEHCLLLEIFTKVGIGTMIGEY